MKETKMSAEKVVKEPKPKLMNIKLGMWWTGMWTKVSRVPPPQNALNLCAAQRERDRYRYKVMTKLNITIVSANTLVSVPGEDDLELLDTVADEDVDLEAEAMHHLDLEILKKALQALTKEEYRIIRCLYLSKSPMSEKEIAKHLGMTQQAVSKRKRAIFEKLKKYF